MIKQVYNKVRFVLDKKVKARDDDRLLIANIWAGELKKMGKDIESITAKEFLETFCLSEGISSPESIRRCRQKIQEVEAQYRGENYKGRIAKELEVRQEVIEWQSSSKQS